MMRITRPIQELLNDLDKQKAIIQELRKENERLQRENKQLKRVGIN